MKINKRKIKYMLNESMTYIIIVIGGIIASFMSIEFANFISFFIGYALAYIVTILILRLLVKLANKIKNRY